MSTGAGFYKRDGDRLLYASTAVFSPSYTLRVSERGTYTLPHDGWDFFETEAEARAAYSLPKPPSPVIFGASR